METNREKELRRWRIRTFQADDTRYLEEYCNEVCFRTYGRFYSMIMDFSKWYGDVYLRIYFGFYYFDDSRFVHGICMRMNDGDMKLNVEGWGEYRVEIKFDGSLHM